MGFTQQMIIRRIWQAGERQIIPLRLNLSAHYIWIAFIALLFHHHSVAAESGEVRLELKVHIPSAVRILGPVDSDSKRQTLTVAGEKPTLVKAGDADSVAEWELIPVGEFGRYLVLRTRNPAKREAKTADAEQFSYVALGGEKKADAPLILVTNEKKAQQWELFSTGKKDFLLSTPDLSKQALFFGPNLTLSKTPIVLTWDDR
jgi:hypothetical protein